jgi:hypothetical protein
MGRVGLVYMGKREIQTKDSFENLKEETNWDMEAQMGFNNLMVHRIKGFSDFVHRPNSKELEDKNTTFRKLDLFPSSSSNSLEFGRWTNSENP